MGRKPCCSKEGLNRGAWTDEENKILSEYITLHGEGSWRNLPKRAGLKRCGRSCRLRWLNYLKPTIKRGNISSDEEELIIRLHKLLGNRWSLIAGRLPGRTDNEIKNYWKTNLAKKEKDGNKTTHLHVTNISNTHNPIPELDSNVIRTKATKCSKHVLFLNPLPQYPSMQLHNNSKPEAQVQKQEAMLVDAVASNISSVSNQIEATTTYGNIGFVSFPVDDEEEKALSNIDWLVDLDFNMGYDDINLSDFLNSSSDFSNISVDQLDHPMFFDQVLNNWTQSSSADVITNVSNSLH